MFPVSMNVVTSHVGADFDSLASMIAATKLYPDSAPVFSGSVERRVREFCNLFEEALPLKRSRDIDRDHVHTLVVVDCADARRLGAFAPLATSGRVHLHVYDHHSTGGAASDAPGGLDPEVYVCEPVGATTTLLLNRLPQDAEIESWEATLFALGIYEETGALLHSNTTVADVECVADLLRRGANLDLVSAYVNRSMTPEQRELLDRLVLSAEHHDLRGLPVCLAGAATERFVGGVAILTAKLMDILNVALAVVLVEQQGTIVVIGRSRVDTVDLAAVMKTLGGGGHHRAASATLRGMTLAEAHTRLWEALEAHAQQLATAGAIMSYPVRSVTPDTTVADAARVMLRYGHSGLLVAEEESGKIEGIVTRRDVDAAQRHQLGHAPVKCCMSRRVQTVAPETSVLELESLMAQSGVGRIPVVDHGRLVGIVTRGDVLNALYHCLRGGHKATYRQAAAGPGTDVGPLLERHLGTEKVDLLRRLGRWGAEFDTPCYLVGGTVRDLLLGAPTIDLDVLVENSALTLARAAAERLDAEVRCHKRFGTAQLLVSEDVKIDFATARTEFYEHPAALPEVEFSSLREDLYRRDFTINTMAVDLAPEAFGGLLDYFGGEQDLREGVIRVLHNLSFVEDPTRMFRAVRFEQRFGFTIEPQTEALIVAERNPAALEALTPERLRNELILLLKETDPVPALHRLAHLDLLKEIDPSLELDEEVLAHLRRMQDVLTWAETALPPEPILRWPLMLWPLLAPLAIVTVRSLCQRLRFSQRAASVLETAQESGPPLAKTLSSSRRLPDSTLHYLLEDLPVEVQLAAVSLEDSPRIRERVEHFHRSLKHARADITGDDLRARGYEPGPAFRPALAAALQVKLDQPGATRGQQLEAAVAVLERAGAVTKTR